ncbi:MAG: hypothetical protein OWT27_06230 [Firmicutes bacterium]|nr:hypothetical protein [Bacillota bacterium]
MRQHLVRSAATVIIWVCGLEVVSSFAVKLLYDYDLNFTPVFLGLGIIGVALLVASRFF